jgi:hypothetical protein
MDAASIVASGMTVSDKIRALSRMGHTRADIARMLGKRYQHVRNVLEADERLAAANVTGVAEPAAAFASAQPSGDPGQAGGGWLRLEIGEDGAVRLPTDVMAALDVRPNGIAMAQWKDGALRIVRVSEWVADVQAWVASIVRPGVSLVDELIAERRREFEKEEREYRSGRTDEER